MGEAELEESLQVDGGGSGGRARCGCGRCPRGRRHGGRVGRARRGCVPPSVASVGSRRRSRRGARRRRASTSSASWGVSLRMRPLAAVVQRSRIGQRWQCCSKTALLAAVRVTVCPAGQVAVRVAILCQASQATYRDPHRHLPGRAHRHPHRRQQCCLRATLPPLPDA